MAASPCWVMKSTANRRSAIFADLQDPLLSGRSRPDDSGHRPDRVWIAINSAVPGQFRAEVRAADSASAGCRRWEQGRPRASLSLRGDVVDLCACRSACACARRARRRGRSLRTARHSCPAPHRAARWVADAVVLEEAGRIRSDPACRRLRSRPGCDARRRDRATARNGQRAPLPIIPDMTAAPSRCLRCAATP